MESKEGKAYSAWQEIVETDSIRVLFVYDFPGPGRLYKAREGAVDRIFRTLEILAPDLI